MVVDTDVYIQSQPVNFQQIEDVVTSIGNPVDVYINVSRVHVFDVDLIGMVKLIWDLHQRTKGQILLKHIYVTDASPYVTYVWNALRCMLPGFVNKMLVITNA
jgi:hypothetical protein